MKTKLERILVLIVFWVLFAQVTVAANDLMALQGTVNTTGTGNITVTIWDSPAAGNKLYDSSQDFIGSVQNGRYDILLGSGANKLSLDYGKVYYLDLNINGQDLDFNGSARQEFQSSIGNVTGTYIEHSSISSVNILEESLSGVNIANDSIQKNKIETAGSWIESEIPALTSSWIGTLDASRIAYPLLLNVNNSQFLGTYSASIFFSNDTMLSQRIDALNQTGNIKRLGFNTTAELDSRYSQVGASGGNSTQQMVEAVNKTGGTYSIAVLWANIVNRITKLSDLSQDMNYINTTDNQTLTNAINNRVVIGTKLGNTTAEIQAAESDAAAIGKLGTYANQTYVQDSNSTLWTAINSRMINGTSLGQSDNSTIWNSINNRLINGTALTQNDNTSLWNAINNRIINGTVAAAGITNNSGTWNINTTEKKGNSSAEIQAAESDSNTIGKLATYANQTQVQTLLSTYQNQSTTQGLLSTYENQSMSQGLLSTYANQTYVQSTNTSIWTAVNNRMINGTALGQSDNNTLWSAVNNRLINGTKVGNSTAEIQAAESDSNAIGKLATYANQTQVQTLLSTYQNQSLTQTLLSTYANQSTTQTLLSTYANQTYLQASNTTIWTAINNRLINGTKIGNSTSEINAVESDPIVLPKLATYANQSWVSDSNTSIWSGINLRATITSVQTLLSTYINLSLLQDTNTTMWNIITDNNRSTRTAINNRLINGTKVGNSTAEINAVEEDPEVGLTTAGSWCEGNGTGVNCNVTAITKVSQLANDMNYEVVNYQHLTLTSNLTESTVTVNRYGRPLNFSVIAGNTYKFEFDVVFTTKVTTTGIRLGLDVPPFTVYTATVDIPVAANGTTAAFHGWLTTANDTVLGSGVQTINTRYLAKIEGIIEPTADGNVTLIYASEVGGTGVTIGEGSMVFAYNWT